MEQFRLLSTWHSVCCFSAVTSSSSALKNNYAWWIWLVLSHSVQFSSFMGVRELKVKIDAWKFTHDWSEYASTQVQMIRHNLVCTKRSPKRKKHDVDQLAPLAKDPPHPHPPPPPLAMLHSLLEENFYRQFVLYSPRAFLSLIVFRFIGERLIISNYWIRTPLFNDKDCFKKTQHPITFTHLIFLCYM